MMLYRNGTRFKLHQLTSSEIITACNGEQINLNQQVQGGKGISWIVKKVVLNLVATLKLAKVRSLLLNNSKHNKSDKV